MSESKKIAYESLVLSLLFKVVWLGMLGCKCWEHEASSALPHESRVGSAFGSSLLQRCWVVDGKQPSGKIKVLYDSAVQKLLDEVGLSLLDAANKSECQWHNISRPEALAAQARAASGVSAQVAAAKRPSQAAVTKGAASSSDIHFTSSGQTVVPR